MIRRSSIAGATSPVPPTGADVEELCAIVARRTGMTVSETKRGVVAVRLATRLRELGLRTLEEYCAHVERSDAELLHVIDLVTTHETSFFRHPHHFAFLAEQLVPQWRSEAALARRAHQVRVWSAGCSTGEEPYSIAMVLAAALSPLAGWSVEVLATDISEAALARARTATFAADRGWQIPDDYRRLFTRETRDARDLRDRPPDAGGRVEMRVGPEITRAVRFERVNLLDEIYPVGRDYDVVFCRNVLIYFRPEVRRAVVDRLVDHLAPDGHLILGQAEGLLGASRLRRIAPTVYRLAGAAGTLPPSSRPPRRMGGSPAPVVRRRR